MNENHTLCPLPSPPSIDRLDMVSTDEMQSAHNTVLETLSRYCSTQRQSMQTEMDENGVGTSAAPEPQYWPRIVMLLTEIRSIAMCTQNVLLQEACKETFSQLPWYYHELFLGDHELRKVKLVETTMVEADDSMENSGATQQTQQQDTVTEQQTTVSMGTVASNL